MLGSAGKASFKAGRTPATCSTEPAMPKRFLVLGALLAASALAAPLPYDESADAKADIRQALAAAKESRTPVFLVFGATWGEDCRALTLPLKSGRSAKRLARQFKAVKVRSWNFHQNLHLLSAYSTPLRTRIPAPVLRHP